ncbi:MAG TPA: NAD(P)/FAD-dependent oxidoreductase [Candidatus Diapherotrites archaeon]|nr:NAD(P)/FAD-dependent oxidoreductase [Candidatus Diapherotrites archaeon]
MIRGLETRIIIVGAGPAGLYCGYLIKRFNPNILVTIIENDKEVGIPKACTGHISIFGLKKLKLTPFLDIDKLVVNRIRGANIHGPSKAELQFRTKKFQTVVVDRVIFDREIEKLARNVGVEILLGHQVVSVQDGSVAVNIIDENRLIYLDYTYLIGADGPNSIVRNAFTEKPSTEEFISTYQITANGDFTKDMVELYFGDFSKNFFVWIVPESYTIARIGIGVPLGQNPKQALDDFIAKRNIKLTNIKFDCSGQIPVSKPITNYYENKKLLIGDAACFVKATSGGGIIFGLTSAECAAKAITERLKHFKKLENYNKHLKPVIRELNIHYKLYKYKSQKTNIEFDNLLLRLKDAGIEDFLNNNGNIDYPSNFIPKLVFYPKFLVFYKELIDLIKSK